MPSEVRCEECHLELEVGDWPYCPHPKVHGRDSRLFEPIVVWKHNTEVDKYSFPGQGDERVPDGYHKVEIHNLRDADRLVREINRIERSKSIDARSLNYQALDEATRIRRRDIDARIRGNPRAEALFRAAREWADKRKAKNRAKHSQEPNFHIDILSFDSGNRRSYSGPETQWRETKK
jgi:hypothetical protein